MDNNAVALLLPNAFAVTVAFFDPRAAGQMRLSELADYAVGQPYSIYITQDPKVVTGSWVVVYREKLPFLGYVRSVSPSIPEESIIKFPFVVSVVDFAPYEKFLARAQKIEETLRAIEQTPEALSLRDRILSNIPKGEHTKIELALQQLRTPE